MAWPLLLSTCTALARLTAWEAIEMSVESLTAFGIGSRSFSPLARVPPRSGFGGSLAAHGPLAKAFFKVHQILEALKGTPRKRPGGGGPQEEPEEDSILKDPAFWMLLTIH
jgi:hypothetical protein